MDLVLINPPFSAPNYPSIQLGILQTLAQEAGLSVHTLNVNLRFYNAIPSVLYDAVAEHRGVRVGDWLFAETAFGRDTRSEKFQDRFKAELEALCNKIGLTFAELLDIRADAVPRWVEKTCCEILELDPKTVGFTSTFEQNVTGLALARVLKSKSPEIKNIFGGANFDGEMGFEQFRSFHWIDYVVVGEVEPVFQALLSVVGLSTEHIEAPASILRREIPLPNSVARSTFNGSMDTVPVPDYNDYFEEIDSLKIPVDSFRQRLTIPIETSRGCWWGEKQHCTFCGLNGAGMTFRGRSPTNAIDLIKTLARRHKVSHFSAVDNIINPRLINELHESDAIREADLDFFFEIKANLRWSDLEKLANSGVSSIQPGIESLSSNVLRRMKKGIKAIQNVSTLKWARFYGIDVSWNMLFGFPGENLSDYQQQANLIPNLLHLQPPVGGGRIWLERFSPYYTQNTPSFENRRPEKSLKYIYPDSVDLEKIAYFFDYDPKDTITEHDFSSIDLLLKEWREKWTKKPKPFLSYLGELGSIVVVDGRRDPVRPILIRYKAPLDSLFRYCDERPRSFAMITDHLEKVVGSKIEEASVRRVLGRLVERGFLMQEEEIYLSLVLPNKRTVRRAVHDEAKFVNEGVQLPARANIP